MASFLERRRLLAFSAVVQAARRHFSGDSAKSLLDLGGGTGWLAEELGQGLTRIVVLEPRAKARAVGQKRRPAAEFVEGRAEAIPFPDGSFDRLIAVGSLHHFADPVKGLAEMRRALSPGGRLAVFEYPPDRGKGRFLVRFACHHSLRKPAELVSLVAAAGFVQPVARDCPPGYLVLAGALTRRPPLAPSATSAIARGQSGEMAKSREGHSGRP